MDRQPGSPPPVTFDRAHPYVPNNTGKQPTFRIADLNNPNLTNSPRTAYGNPNESAPRQGDVFARGAACWATGVPVYLLNPAQPTFSCRRQRKSR